MSDGPLILPMCRADLDVVEHIVAASFRLPWNREELEKELEREWAVARVLRPRHGARVCAFINYWLVGGDELQIMNIAVDPEHRRRGYAHALLQEAITSAWNGGVQSLFLEVRESNHGAQALYTRFGFQTIGVRPHYYSDNHEDAFVMQLRLDAPV
jgi:ribosomal-protein-alanine N-acetyltransferase